MRKIYSYFLSLMLTALLCIPWTSNAYAAQSLPYSYGFETALETDGWTFVVKKGSNSSYTGIRTAASKTGTNGYSLSSYSNAADQYLISPELDAPNGVILQFYYRAGSSYSTETFKVGYSTTDAAPESFTWGTEISASNTNYDEQPAEFIFPTGTKYVAVNYYSNSDRYYLYVDDFTFASAGLSNTCPAPTALTIGTITANSATFSWTAGASETQWQYLCLPADEEPDWTSASVKTATSATATVEGLDPSTSYKFYVRAYCDSEDQSAAVSTAFKTPCVAITTLPWSCDFESPVVGYGTYIIPDCWEKIASGNYPYIYNYSYYANSGNQSLYFYGGMSSPIAIILPAFAEKTSKLQVSFWYNNTSTSSYYGNAQIGYMTDPSDISTFTALKTLDKVSSYTQVKDFAMTGAPDNSFIAIRLTGGEYNSYLYLDDISVDLAPSCLAPSAPTASDITISSAKLTWTANSGESAWTLQYSTDGETWTDKAVSAKPYTLEGLSANTLYYVRVKAKCGATDESSYGEIASFRTACGAISTLPWKYGFEDATDETLPACWNSIPYDYYGTDIPYVDSYSTANNGSKYMYFYGGGASSSSIAILPEFEESISGLVLSFYYKNSSVNANYAKLKVGYITDPSDASSFVAVETLDQVTTYAKVGPFAFTGAPAGAYMAIQFAGGSSAYGTAYLDDITVDIAPSCMQPSGVKATSVTDEGAVISWTAGGSETAWALQYKRYDGDWSADINVTTASYTLTGLDANTNYYVRVKALCGGEDVSDWTNSLNFKTTCGVNAMPFEEDFGSTSAIPDCWTVGKTGGSYQWAPDYDTPSNYYLKFRTSSGSTYSYLTLPAIALTEDAQLTFDWRNSNNVTADLLISTNGGATFTSIPNHGLSATASSWESMKYDLSAYTGETVIICFRGYNGTANRYLRIDNIRVEAKPCEALAAPTAAPTIDGGTISWTGNAKALRYQAVGASTWNTVAVTGTSYLLTGLEASTSYNVQVQVACAAGDDDLWSNSLTFTTRCAATDELPYSNNFDAEESNEMPACWSKISATDYPYVYSGAAAYGGTGKFLYFYGSAEQIAVLPALTADLSTLTFSLYYKGGSANFQLGYVKADGVTFVALETLPALTAFGAEPYELDLASIPAEAKYLAIRYSSTSNYASGYVDNVVVKKTPTCFKPASIAASAITANSATVAWTASGKGETQYQYVCVPAGETPDWAAATMTDELSATLTTLAPTTEYDFYVRSYCGTEDQSDAVKTSFTTKCAAAALPFDEDFDAVADYDMPECWNVYAATYYSAYVANGQLRADAPKTNATVIVLPELEASFVGASVAFNYSTSNGTLEVGYVTDAEDQNSFVAVSEALTAASTTQVLVPFTAGSGNIAFRFIGNTGDGDLYLDNIRVSNTLVLANDADNTAALEANNGQTLDVQIDRTFFPGVGFNTICLPFSLPTLVGTPLEGGELLAFKYGYVENGELLLRVYPTDAIEAGVPYLISWETGANIVSPIFKNVTIAASEGKAVGENDDVKFVGIFAPQIFPQGDKTKIFVLANNQMAWSGVEATAANSLKSFRAYFQTITEVGGGANNAPIYNGMPARIVKQESSATDIDNIYGNDVKSIKLLENNQVVIIRNGVKYNVQGQVIK